MKGTIRALGYKTGISTDSFQGLGPGAGQVARLQLWRRSRHLCWINICQKWWRALYGRRGSEILEQTSVETVKAVAPGVSELEVYIAFVKVLHENGVFPSFHIMCSSPDIVSWGQPPWLFNVWEPRLLQPGDVVLADIFVSIGGLESQIPAALAIPPVSSIDQGCADLARKSYEEGIR
jgi:hypothetical protein